MLFSFILFLYIYLLGVRPNMNKHFISSIEATIGSGAFFPTAIV